MIEIFLALPCKKQYFLQKHSPKLPSIKPKTSLLQGLPFPARISFLRFSFLFFIMHIFQ
jgi:hypothetical protein